MLTSRLFLMLTLGCALLTSGLVTLARVSGAVNPAGGFLAFSRFAERRSDIFVYDPNTQFTLNLTRTPNRSEDNPAWSRGGRLAFVADETGQMGLYVQDMNGGSAVRLLLTFAPMSDPTWANDQQLAYVSGED